MFLLFECWNQAFYLHRIGKILLYLPRIEPSVNSKMTNMHSCMITLVVELLFTSCVKLHTPTYWSLSMMCVCLVRTLASHSTPTATFHPGNCSSWGITCGLWMVDSVKGHVIKSVFFFLFLPMLWCYILLNPWGH